MEAELTNVPFAQASASGPEAKAETGVSWKYTPVLVQELTLEKLEQVHLLLELVLKLALDLEMGVPEADLGPVTVPCSIM